MPKPFAQVAQAVIVGSLHGQETNNVMHFGGNGAENSLTDLMNDILACIISSLKPATSDEWTLSKVTARRLFPTLGDPVDRLPDAAVAGTGLPAEASFVANIIRINTGLGGRRHRGRIFLPGVIANDVNHSQLTPGGLAKVAAFALCLAGKFIAGGVDQPAWEIGVLSRTTAKEAGQTIETGFFPATKLTAQPIVGCMRSRRIGHGG